MLTNLPKRALKSFTKGQGLNSFAASRRAGRRRKKMIFAVARPTVVVVASLLLVNRATANSDDDDDDESDEHLSYSVWIACGLFVVLFLLFDLLRTRMWSESTKTFARPRSRGGARGPRESSR